MFVLGTVVPIAVASVLVFKHVEGSLKEQAYAELRHASKFYGLSVLERLLSAQTKLRRITDRIAVAPDAGIDPYEALTPEFSFIARVDARGTVHTLAGDAQGDIGPASHFSASSDGRKAALFVAPVNAQKNARVLMSVPSGHGETEVAQLIAELNNITLWGREESRPMAFEFCAVMVRNRFFARPTYPIGYQRTSTPHWRIPYPVHSPGPLSMTITWECAASSSYLLDLPHVRGPSSPLRQRRRPLSPLTPSGSVFLSLC